MNLIDKEISELIEGDSSLVTMSRSTLRILTPFFFIFLMFAPFFLWELLSKNSSNKIKVDLLDKVGHLTDIHDIINTKIDAYNVQNLPHIPFPFVRYFIYLFMLISFIAGAVCFYIFKPRSYILLNQFTENTMRSNKSIKSRAWFVVLISLVAGVISSLFANYIQAFFA
jgi:hypothetical protein